MKLFIGVGFQLQQPTLIEDRCIAVGAATTSRQADTVFPQLGAGFIDPLTANDPAAGMAGACPS